MPGVTSSPVRMLHDFFDRSAARHPGRIAVDVPPSHARPTRSTVTYRQLLLQADDLAHRLSSLVAPDAVVGIMLPRDSHHLYAAQLAVLKAGAAFTCIDPVFPDAFVAAVLADGNISVLLTDQPHLARLCDAKLAPPHAQLQPLDITALPVPPEPKPLPGISTSPEHLAYLIYTSGTTGTPKGVMIEHRSIINLVDSDLAEFRLTPNDRVAQGSSAAYDSSIEEIWLAFAAGATLVVMDDHTSRLGPDLVPWLQNERITVFCPPPTLLRTTACTNPAQALPDLRLLYVGGEALTDDLVNLWAPGRRLVNGYGPTECTVTVVRGDITPGHPVTIGQPVPGHTAWIVDDYLNPVPDGDSGELCLAGPGLARGYRNRPDTTRDKFPRHPTLGRLYRTGDLVRRETDHNLTYLGRIDAQVKVRGYRIELEAIETRLAQCPGIREAACRVQGDHTSALLAAHLVPTDPTTPPDPAHLRESLRASLPHYMVPARIGFTDALPRTVGGKLDRKRLPDLPPDSTTDTNMDATRRDPIPPASDLEAAILAAFASALNTSTPISTHDDFFLDLGGDSLSAVGVVCLLRQSPQTAAITTRDLYEARTAAKLAQTLDPALAAPTLEHVSPPIEPSHIARPFLVTTLQSLWLLLQLLVVSLVAYSAVFDLLPFLLQRFGLLGTLLLEIPLALAATLGYILFSVAFAVVLKLALIGEYRTLRTPVWSTYYLRHWIVQSAARAIPWSLFAGTPIYPAILRLLGATVGRNVHIHRGVNLQLGGWDLLTLGDNVTLSRDVHLSLIELDSGCLAVGPVTIHADATLDTRANVSAHTTIDQGAFLSALSWLPSGQRIPANERWDGVPAARIGLAPPASAISAGKPLHPALYSTLHLAALNISSITNTLPVLAILYILALLLHLDASQVVEWLDTPTWQLAPTLLLIAASILIVPLWLAARALALRLLGPVTPAVVPRFSLAALRVLIKTNQVESAGTWLTGTLFWPLWLRLAGMRVGRDCEISTIIDVVPESISIGPESFFADGIYLGGPRHHRGTLTIANTSLARGTFLGNHVIIPAGSTLPEDLFIGVCTVADPSRARPATSWFGHPPLELPRRDVVDIDRRLTHDPGPLRYADRLFWESLRFSLPFLPIAIASFWLATSSSLATLSPLSAACAAALITLATLVLQCLAVVALKWLLLGRARAGQHALWSCWCSRWDFLYVVWQFFAIPPLAALEGTLLLPIFLRSMGARIGHRVVLGPGMAQLADPDMIIIEDHATVSANYQAHSFEDRVLKLAPVFVRRNATIGESAVLFYGSEIGENARVSPESVVMKNERLLPNLAYAGCPVQAHQTINVLPDQPAPSASHTTTNTSARETPLDSARGIAVIGMIYMHLVPAESAASGAFSPWAWLAQLLEGKSAALFCILAGFAWEFQARTPRTRWFYPRRIATLAAAGIVLHILAWPTEILVPLALMMTCALALRHLGERATLAVLVLTLLLAPCIPAFFSNVIELDLLEDGSHAADSSIGWVTLRALLIDGNYPLIPWLAFPLTGMLLARRWSLPRTKKICLGSAIAIAALGQLLPLLPALAPDSADALEPYLSSTWQPTSIPFVLISGGFALAIIASLAVWQASTPPTTSTTLARRTLASFGRASLTHYLLHIALVYVPLSSILNSDEWPVSVGLLAFAAYLALALPLTALWFRRFKRGPAETLWNLASGPTCEIRPQSPSSPPINL